MLNWWQARTERERRILFWSFMVFIFCFGFYVWMLMNRKIDHWNKNLVESRHLWHALVFVENQTIILRQRGRSSSHHVHDKTESLLASVQRSLLKARLTKYLGQPAKLQKGKVRLDFVRVPFDDWLHWFTEFMRYNEYMLVRLKARKTGRPGTANVELVLAGA